MRMLYLIVSYLILSIPIYGQQTIDLFTGETSESIVSPNPSRSIKEVEDGIIVNYQFSNATLQNDNIYKTTKIININGFGVNTTPTEPSIIARRDAFTIPVGMDFDIIITDSSFIEVPLELAPARPLLKVDATEYYSLENVPNIEPYTGYFPNSLISNTRIDKYRGNTIAKVKICPTQYDYQNKKVRIYNNITYKVQFKENSNLENQVVKPSGNYLYNSTLNGSQTDAYTTRAVVPTSDYLIISHPKYINAVHTFAQWKQMMGFNVTIELRDNWTPSTIKTFVENKYYRSNSLDYMLIIGGNDDVPTQHMQKHVTDMYYACMDGQNDVIPDIYYGRLPATNENEANTMVNKIIAYEKYPVTLENFYSTGIHCAYFDDGIISDSIIQNGNHNYEGTDGYEDYRHVQTSEDIRNYMISLGKTIKRIYAAENSVNPKYWNNDVISTGNEIPKELQKPYFAWNGNSNDINNGINDGAFYVLYKGHGNFDSWYAPSYTSSSIDQLANGYMQPVVFNITCETGNFSNTQPCLAQSLLSKNYGGGVAVIAATGNSLILAGDAMSVGIFNTIWPNPGISVNYLNYGTINPENRSPIYQLGAIMELSLNKMEEVFDTESKEMREMYHCFGDPSMQMLTTVPTRFDNIMIERDENYINVTGAGSNSIITFYDTYNNESISHKGTNAVFEGENNNIIVCVHEYGKIPYIDQPDVYYYQDETVSGDDTDADIIRIGSNVTPEITEGPVIFDGEKTILRCKHLIMKGETTVTKGTELDVIIKKE